MGYQARLADVIEARAQLLPLWAANLPVDGDLDDKLQWFYREGPHGSGAAFVLESVEGAVIGCAGVGVRTIWHRDRPRRAALFADLAIERAQRSGFPALVLVRAVNQHVLDTFDLGYGLPNAKAEPVYRRTGHASLGELARYVRVLRCSRYLERRFELPRLARTVGPLVDHALDLASRLRARRGARRFELRWLDDFDPRFAALWEEARHAYPVVCERTPSFLRWRFLRQPAHHYRIAALVEPGTRRIRAYAVVCEAHGVARIADLFGPGMPELDALLRRLVPALYETGCESIEMRFLGAPWIPELLAAHGFARRPETRAVTLVVDDALPGAAELRDAAAWYLTDLDEDT
jgi:hypothetical protein